MKKVWQGLCFGFVSLSVGFVNGFFGGGGGMLCVPLLEYGAKLPTKQAHATAIPIILPITVASAVVYLAGGYFRIFDTVSVGSGVVIGGVAGALLLKKLSPFWVGLVFSLVMIGVGVRLCFAS